MLSPHDRQTCAKRQRDVETLRIIADKIRIARDFVDVACEATRTTNNSVATLLIAVSDKLTDASDVLASQLEGTPDVA